MKYFLQLALLFALSPTIVSEQVFKHHDEALIESARISSFEQTLNKRIPRFDTAGKTLVACVVELAFAYELPTAIEYADRDATTRPLNLDFHDESVRRILESITGQIPGYSASFRME